MKVYCISLLLLFFVSLSFTAIPVIIDTDIGEDFDDSWSVSVCLASPELDIKLILTAAHNATGRAQIVAKFLQTINRTDINVGVGISQDDFVGPLYGWAQDYNLSSYPGNMYFDGIQAALDIINSSPVPVTILAIAPDGNIQKMLSMQPSIVKKVNIVAMSGSVYKCYNNVTGACPEYNVYENVPASQAMYSAGWNLTTTPLDTCGIAIVDGATYQTLVAANNSDHILVQTLLQNYAYWYEHGQSPFDPSTSSTVLYDAVAAYLSYSSLSLVDMMDVKLIVSNNGTTEISPNGQTVSAALNWVNGGLSQWGQQLVTRLIKY